MKLTKLMSAMTLMAVLSFSCAPEDLSNDAIDSTILANAPDAKTIEIEILELINTHRIEQGLNPLNNLNIIKSVAYSHTDYMVGMNQVNHDNFFQRKTSLIQNAGAAKVSENVAYGYSTAENVVNAWINSPGHKANMEGDFTDFDISAEQNNEGRWFFTNIFIKK